MPPANDIGLLIAALADKRRLAAVTLWPSGKGWQANVKNDLGGWNCVTGPDPVAALREALSGPFATPSVPGGVVATRDAEDVFG